MNPIDRSKAPATYPFEHRPLPRPTTEVLANGIDFHYYSGGAQPVCALTLYFDGGIGEFGIDITPRLMLSQLTEGAKGIAGVEVADIMDFNGVRTGTAMHAHHSSANYAMLTGSLPRIMALLTDIYAAPTFPAERLDTAKLRAKAQLEAAQRELTHIADEAFAPLIMGSEHPFAQAQTGAAIDAIKRADIENVYRTMMCPTRTHAFLAGQLTPESVDAVRAFLEGLPAIGTGYSTAITPFMPAAPGTRATARAPQAMQSAIFAGIPAIARTHPDYIPLRLTVMALGGYFGSRLMANIREDKGLTYGINAFLIGQQEGAYMKLGAQCDKRYTDTVITEICAEMRRLATEPPAGDELRRLKLHAATDLVEILDTPRSIMSYYTNRLLVGTPPDYFEEQQRAIDDLTPDTIATMAMRYLGPSSLRFAIV